MTSSVICVDDLSASYQKNKVLNDVSFEVKEGTITAIVGPNGAGKSTLIKTMLGLHPKLTGNVRFWGSPLKLQRRKSVMSLNAARLTGIFQRMLWM